MGVGQFSVAAATAVLDYDLADNQWWQQVGYNRFITGFGLKGSAAALDTKVRLMVDTVEIGQFYNTAAGCPNMDDLFPLGGNFVPAGTRLHIIVTDAPATNPINGVLTWNP